MFLCALPRIPPTDWVIGLSREVVTATKCLLARVGEQCVKCSEAHI